MAAGGHGKHPFAAVRGDDLVKKGGGAGAVEVQEEHARVAQGLVAVRLAAVNQGNLPRRGERPPAVVKNLHGACVHIQQHKIAMAVALGDRGSVQKIVAVAQGIAPHLGRIKK